MEVADIKFTNLLKSLGEMESALLAYSGGADSTFLLKAMQISGIKSLAVTAVSEIIPHSDALMSAQTAEELGMQHRVLRTAPLSIEDFVINTPERCFFCKDDLFSKLSAIAQGEGYNFLLDGTNTDDTSDRRPGRKAAMKNGVRSPLAEAGFSKREIREKSRQQGLPTWDRPSSPCLATRIPYGQRITKESLERVERSEDFLRSLGFRTIRVRNHRDVARIEVGAEEIDLMLNPEKREIISGILKSFGYKFVSLDLEGYRSGSMDEILNSSKDLCSRTDI
jgi:pyridinium-3,5-biscarboxylic acid mononucleotide sulfurtransferase